LCVCVCARARARARVCMWVGACARPRVGLKCRARTRVCVCVRVLRGFYGKGCCTVLVLANNSSIPVTAALCNAGCGLLLSLSPILLCLLYLWGIGL
jgi:hypothetical protein